MAGRPKREEEVTPVLLRIPPALLKRVERCKALLELQEGTSISRTDVFWRIIEAGCDALEHHLTLSDIENMIATISDIAGNRLKPVASQKVSAPKTQAFESSTTVLPAHIQRIAETRAEYEKLSLAELSQLLYDRNIYRARDRQSGEEKPVNRGTLQKWLEQAQEAGLL